MLVDFLEPYKGTLVKLAVKELMGLLLKKAPFLALGPVNWFLTQIISFIVGRLLTQGIKEADIIWSAQQKDGLVLAIAKLLDDYEGAESEEERDKIEKELIENSRDFIKLRGMRPSNPK